jgi:FkbM family methyltransferase
MARSAGILAGVRARDRTIVVAYRGIPHARGWATGDNLVRAFRRLGHEVYPYGNYYQTDERLSDDPPPDRADLLVYCECNDDDPEYTELQDRNFGLKSYWDFDVDNGRQETAADLIAQLDFDVVFHANRRYGPFFQRLASRAVFLPYAFDDEHFFPIDRDRPIDVGLVGSRYPERAAYLDRLGEHGAEVTVLSGVYREELVEAIAQLKMHLNLNIDGRGGAGLLVGRVWETIGCGRPLLTERKDYVEELFRDSEHVVLFNGVEDCADKIRFLLDNERERERIARQGWDHGISNHTYLARARRILEICDDAAATPAPRPVAKTSSSAPAAAGGGAGTRIVRRLLRRPPTPPLVPSDEGPMPLALIAEYLPPNPLVIEAGAHSGRDTVRMAHAWPTATIHAFEPIPRLHDTLRRNTARLANVVTHRLALGTEDGSARIFVSGGASDGSSSLLRPKDHLRDHPEVTFDEELEVETRTLVTWLQQAGVDHVDFLWLDLQGLELAVLEAGEDVLAGVSAIKSEVNLVETYEGVPSYERLKEWLAARGFSPVVEDIPWPDGGDVLFARERRTDGA